MARKKNEIVKKSNAIVRAYWPIESVWEPRIVAHLASRIHVNDEDFKIYMIPIAEILGQNYGGDHLNELRAAVKNIMKHPFTISETLNREAIYNIFSKAVIDRKTGVLEIRFDPDLKPHFLQLKEHFTQYKLTEFLSLQSIYSQRLYEILKSYSSQQYVDIDLGELHKALNVPASFKAKFDNFRRRVLEQAHKDIVGSKLSLWFDGQLIKSGRGGKVTAIHFTFRPQKQTEGNDEELIRARLAKLSSSCYYGLMKRKVECTPRPDKSAKCKYCVEHGNMSFKLRSKAR